GQWLDGAARAGCRPPARLLPRLLELGASAAGLRPALVEVIGPRGRWLAAHDDRWAWATGQPIDSGEAAARRFASGPRAERPGGADAAGPDRRRLAGDRRRAGGGLTVARPPEPDAAARRDGVGGAAPAGMGASAWRVAQLVAGAPLAFWAEQLGQGPAEVVALAADGAPEG